MRRILEAILWSLRYWARRVPCVATPEPRTSYSRACRSKGGIKIFETQSQALILADNLLSHTMTIKLAEVNKWQRAVPCICLAAVSRHLKPLWLIELTDSSSLQGQMESFEALKATLDLDDQARLDQVISSTFKLNMASASIQHLFRATGRMPNWMSLLRWAKECMV